MKKFLKKLIPVLLLVLFVVPAFTGCDFLGLLSGDPEIEIIGTWNDAFGSITVSGSEIDFGSWKADIVEFNNSGWNGDETALAEGDAGYAVLKYSEAPSWNPGILDKYMILRWKNLTTVSGETTMDYAEGYLNADSYFDTASEAKSTVTNAGGYFMFFTSGAVKE
ncbi:MAG: hypothetical protein JEY99_14735 [Spirochaetales bacterium]|nr:hypothetical protein [Spirochaetales bacterium]